MSPLAANGPDTKLAGLVWLDQDPTSADLVWAVTDQTTGVTCRTSVTHAGAADAQRLARDVDAGTVVVDGTYSCPMDDGSWMGIYSHTARGTQVAVVRLSGCRFIAGPGRKARFGTDQLWSDLARLAPAFVAPRLDG